MPINLYNKKINFKKFLAPLVLVFITTATCAEPDPNFHIYLMFGQSNMEGSAAIESQDRIINNRVKVMSDLNCPNLGRTYGNWYVASPPLNRCWSGLSPGDYFGKTMADAMHTSISIGLVPASVSGTPIELYQKSAPIGRNNADIPTQFNGGYEWLLDMAKKAQTVGVIKGIIFHQGETNNGDPQWKFKVQQIVTDIRADLNIGDVPFLAGETLYAEYNSCCSLHNTEINKLPSVLSNTFIISAAGLPGKDEAHFTTASYRELGIRYAQVMLEKIDMTVVPTSSSAPSNSSSSLSMSSASSATSKTSSASSTLTSASSARSTSSAPKTESGGGTIDWMLIFALGFFCMARRSKI